MKKPLLLLVLVALGISSQGLLATPGPPPMPDNGTTAMLLTTGCGGLLFLRKFLRR